MRATLAVAFAALAAANPVPQGVTSAITPSTSAPADCSPDYDGTFEIQVVNVSSTAKRDLSKRQTNTLMLNLAGGVLTDSQDRTGYVAANQQFQFDSPPQTGAVYTAGFSVCSNGSLAIGGDAVWYQCLSGTFYNLYDSNDAAQCNPVYIQVVGGGSSVATQTADGQVTASAVASQLPDGQPTASPVSSAVCQLTDGQPQVTGCPGVTQISDGQVQATTGAVSQISDGQVQATSAGAVSQISDGQVQATSAAAPVTQISDGQPQAPTSAVVSQISDGQPQAPTGANNTIAAPTPSASVQASTGGAGSLRVEFFGLAAGLLALAMF